MFTQLLGRDLDFETLAPLAPAEAAPPLAPEERSGLIRLMCAIEIPCNPVPVEMEASVAQ